MKKWNGGMELGTVVLFKVLGAKRAAYILGLLGALALLAAATHKWVG